MFWIPEAGIEFDQNIDTKGENKEMELVIFGFRCYEQTTCYKFELGEVIRVKGVSGVGKTTIFQAIQWCLFGYPTAIYPRGKTKIKTCVTLTTPDWSITRKKNPGFLELVWGNERQEDKVAQATINSLFGNRDIWRVCCYLPQNDVCPLLGFSNNQRMEIIESLVFLDEKPEEDINKIIQANTQLKSELERQKELLSSLPTHQVEITAEQVTTLNQRQDEITAAVTSLERELIIETDKNKRYHRLTLELNSILAKLKCIVGVDEATIHAQEELLHQLQVKDALQQQRQRFRELTRRQGHLTSIITTRQQYTQQDYTNCVYKEKKREEEMLVSSKYGCCYSSDAITSRIKQVETLLQGHNISSLIKRRNNIKATTYTNSDAEKIREKINLARRSIDVMTCPSCNVNLRVLSGCLVVASHHPISSSIITAMEEEERIITESIEQQKERHKLELEISSWGKQPAIPLSSTQINLLKQELRALTKITIIPEEKVTSQEIKACLDLDIIEDELSSMDREIMGGDDKISYQTQITQLKHRIKTSKEGLSKHNSLINEKKFKELEIEKLGQVADITQLNRTLGELKVEAREIKDTIQKWEERNKYLEEQAKLEQLNQQWIAVSRLQKIAIAEMCEMLEARIWEINAVMADICQHLFDEPIVIRLELMKTGKTTQVQRNNVHLSISYKGGEYDSLSQLSGGEGRRLSLALSLSLSRLNSFPLLLLDESLTGLDEELKEAALGIIRTFSDKTILCIMHDGVEGYYDSCLNISV